MVQLMVRWTSVQILLVVLVVMVSMMVQLMKLKGIRAHAIFVWVTWIYSFGFHWSSTMNCLWKTTPYSDHLACAGDNAHSEYCDLFSAPRLSRRRFTLVKRHCNHPLRKCRFKRPPWVFQKKSTWHTLGAFEFINQHKSFADPNSLSKGRGLQVIQVTPPLFDPPWWIDLG